MNHAVLVSAVVNRDDLFLKMDSPEGATGREKSFYFILLVRFLKMDSPRSGNWAEEDLLFLVF